PSILRPRAAAPPLIDKCADAPQPAAILIPPRAAPSSAARPRRTKSRTAPPVPAPVTRPRRASPACAADSDPPPRETPRRAQTSMPLPHPWHGLYLSDHLNVK